VACTDLPAFPDSLPGFQRLFPDEAACASYLEKCRWPEGFECSTCKSVGEPFRFANRPGVLRCRECREDTRLTVGTVIEGSHTPLSVWFWGAYLVTTHTPGISARQFQRQLGIPCYETAFQILHKLRAGMVRPDQDRIGGGNESHVEIDETLVGGRTRGKGRGVHKMVSVAGAVEVFWPPDADYKKRKGGRYAGRVRLCVANRSGDTLGNFVQSAVVPGSIVVTDGWQGYDDLTKAGYQHMPVVVGGKAHIAELNLPIIHLVFSNLKTWLRGIHHGVSPQHLQAYLNEFVFRFNRRRSPLNAFRSLMGIAGGATAPTYNALYSGLWQHPRVLDNVPF